MTRPLGIKEVATQVTIDEKHELRRSQWSYRDQVSMLTTSNSHVNKGMRMRVIPLQRIEMMVAMIFTAVPNVPNPPTINASAQ
jgi:hypothetical protein